ncbi:MAG: hypothetical protein ACREOB_07760, partial [Thermodesulfobacteriota bacterium]
MHDFRGPDFHAESLVGWRIFKINNGKLGSVANPHPTSNPFGENWTPTAHCAMDNRHVSPNKNCMCGYWGIWSLETLIKEYLNIGGYKYYVAFIEIKGRVILGTKGFRAEKIRIKGLMSRGLLQHYDNLDSLRFLSYDKVYPKIPRITPNNLEEYTRKEVDPYEFVPEKQRHSGNIFDCDCDVCGLYRELLD